jgi:phosphodiesterase/alkaline phosphatase D-like protein
MISLKPDFFVNLGDLHYSGTNKTTKEEFEFAYHEVFKSSVQRGFYEQVPMAYTFDDHDVGDNNADGTTFSSLEVNKAYKVKITYYQHLLINNRILPLTISLQAVTRSEGYSRASKLARSSSSCLT